MCELARRHPLALVDELVTQLRGPPGEGPGAGAAPEGARRAWRPGQGVETAPAGTTRRKGFKAGMGQIFAMSR